MPNPPKLVNREAGCRMSSGFALKNGALLLSTEAPGGIYNAEQLRQVAKISEDSSMIVKVTEDQRLAIVVSKDQFLKVKQDLAQVGLEVRHYQEGLHQATSCIGKLCSEHQQDALKSSVQISEAMAGLVMTSPVKIGLNGCSRCCNPTHTLDISVVGDDSGYRISLGGKSAMIPEFGQFVAESVPSAKLPVLMRAVVETYAKIGVEGESMQDVIERVGLGPFAKVLAPWSQDAGVEENFSEGSPGELAEFPGGSEEALGSQELPDLSTQGIGTDGFSELALEESDLNLNLEDNIETSELSMDQLDNLQDYLVNGVEISEVASPGLAAGELDRMELDSVELESIELGNADLDIVELDNIELDNIELDSMDLETKKLDDKKLSSQPSKSSASGDMDSSALESPDLDMTELGDIELSGLDDGDLNSLISDDLTMEGNPSTQKASEIKMTLDESEDVSIDLVGLESLDSLDVAIHDAPELNLDEGMDLKVDKITQNLSQEALESSLDEAALELSDDELQTESIAGDLSFDVDGDIASGAMEISEHDLELEDISIDSDLATNVNSGSQTDISLEKQSESVEAVGHSLPASHEIEDEDLGEFGKLQGAEATDADADEIEKKLDSEVDEQLGFQHLSEDENELDREETLSLLDDDSLDNSQAVSLSQDTDSELVDRDSSALEDLSFQAEELSEVDSDLNVHTSESTSTAPQSNVKPLRSANSKVYLEDMDMDMKGQVYLKFSNGLALELGDEIFDGTKKTMKLAGVTLKIDSTNGGRSVELDGIKFSIPATAA